MFSHVYRVGLLVCASLTFLLPVDMASSALLLSWHVRPLNRGLCGIPLPKSVHSALCSQRSSCLAARCPLCVLWVITCFGSVVHVMSVLCAAWTCPAEPVAGDAGQGRGMQGASVLTGPSANPALPEEGKRAASGSPSRGPLRRCSQSVMGLRTQGSAASGDFCVARKAGRRQCCQ